MLVFVIFGGHVFIELARVGAARGVCIWCALCSSVPKCGGHGNRVSPRHVRLSVYRGDRRCSSGCRSGGPCLPLLALPEPSISHLSEVPRCCCHIVRRRLRGLREPVLGAMSHRRRGVVPVRWPGPACQGTWPRGRSPMKACVLQRRANIRRVARRAARAGGALSSGAAVAGPSGPHTGGRHNDDLSWDGAAEVPLSGLSNFGGPLVGVVLPLLMLRMLCAVLVCAWHRRAGSSEIASRSSAPQFAAVWPRSGGVAREHGALHGQRAGRPFGLGRRPARHVGGG